MQKIRSLQELYQILFWYYSFHYSHSSINFTRLLIQLELNKTFNDYEIVNIRLDLNYKLEKKDCENYTSRIEFLQSRIEELK